MRKNTKLFVAPQCLKPLFPLLVLLLFTLSLEVSAQETAARSAASPVNELDDLVVSGQSLQSDQATALKSPTLIIDVPQSLSIITAEQIRNQGFDSIRDLVDYTPGVTTSQGEGHRDAVVFRGTRSTADFYIDGVRDDVQYYRSLYNVEQVEFLRGPNALLFGRGGTGGIINRVMKKGMTGISFNDVNFSADTFGAYSLQVDSNQSLSASSALRVNAAYEALENHRDYFDGERIGLNPTFKIKLDDNVLFDFSYEYVDHNRVIDRGIPTGVDGKPVTAFKDLFFGDTELNYTDLEAHLFRGTLQVGLTENVKLQFDAFYGDYDKVYSNFYTSGYDAANTPDRVKLDGYVDSTQRENLILSADVISELETGPVLHKLVTGVEYIDTVNDNDRYNSFFDTHPEDPGNETFLIGNQVLRNGTGSSVNGPTTNDFTKDLNDDTSAAVRSYSLYTQDEISLGAHWILVLGARFDRFEIEALDRKTGRLRSRTDEEISPRLGLIFKPVENVSLYASYSETFLPRSGEQFATITDETAALDPDTYENRELGVKWDIKPGLSLTTTVFELEKSSPETGKDDAAALSVVKSAVNGFEATLTGRVNERWYVSAGYSFLDGEVESDEEDDGNRPRELPEHMFSIWNTYRLTEKFGLGLGLVYYDETFIDNGNDTRLPSYARLDAALYYDLNERMRLQVNIENLTDELYFPNAHADHQVTVGAPINARFAVVGNF